MKTKRLKSIKLFYLKDVLAYAVILGLVFCLFLFFVITPNCKSAPSSVGFKVEIDGQKFLTYNYETDQFDYDSSNKNLIEINETTDGYVVTIYSDSIKSEFNKLAVNTSAKSVRMTDSNCRSKQCTYLHEVSDSGIIYCAPRNLKISPISSSGFIPPTTGGL